MLNLYPLARNQSHFFFDELRRSLDGFFTPDASWNLAPDFTTPRVLENENEEGFCIQLEAPGFKDDDFQITIEGQTLSVSGRREREMPEKYKAIRQERSALEFKVSRSLPKSVNTSEIKAELKSGILTLTLPKTEESKPRQIKVISNKQED
jgi:HSP20 family protein